jgi:hypothetical protein
MRYNKIQNKSINIESELVSMVMGKLCPTHGGA